MKREPVADAMERLREGKRELRHARVNMSLPDKVQQVVRLQQAVLPMIRRRRPLGPLENVWPIKPR